MARAALILLDSSAVIAHLLDEPARVEVEALLRDGPCAISAANLAEVHDLLIRVVGAEHDEVDAAVGALGVGGALDVAPVYEEVAVHAGRLRAEHYHPKDCEVSLADCVLIATAQANGLTVASSDAQLVAIARAVGLDVHPLPNSRGQRP